MAVTAGSGRETARIAAGTAIGTVHLTVREIERSRSFYERLLGLRAVAQEDGSLALFPGAAAGAAGAASVDGGVPVGAAAGLPPLLSLVGDSTAPPRDPRQTGLFHFAVLVPTRRDLAVALERLAQGGWQLEGASDHLVSEALYLSDPDGNGIEIYRDRPRPEWHHEPDGQVAMTTLPLDLDGLVQELRRPAPADGTATETDTLIDADAPNAVDALMPAGTVIGHVHLQVAELARTEAFYAGVLGFDVMVRGYPGALFVAAGGYHHHIGLNTWHSRGGSSPAPGTVGLRAYEVRVGDAAALDSVLARLDAAGAEIAAPEAVLPSASLGSLGDGAVLVRDPSGNAVLLRV